MQPFHVFLKIFFGMTMGVIFHSQILLNPVLSESSASLNNQETDQLKKQDCYTILVEADQLYQEGQTDKSAELYKQCKEDFGNSTKKKSRIVAPIYQIEELEGGHRLWQKVQDGINRNLDSKIYFNLNSLTEIYPHFIPAHLALADFCLLEPEFCEKNAKENQPKTASQVLERVTEIYPDDSQLLSKKIELFVAEEKYLQASIAARQFAIIYYDDPQAENFSKLADDYLQVFEDEVNSQLISQTIATNLLNIGGAILLKNPYMSLSGLEMIVMLAQGESSFGKQAIKAFVNDQREKKKLIEEPAIIEYIEGIADRMIPYMGRDFEYEFYVVKNDSINAFALPGGKVIIYTGAILNTDSEAEIAGLLGHEISHAVLSHGFLKVIQANFVGSITRVFGSFRQLSRAKSFINYLYPLVTTQYSREAERQSDILGTRALVAGGYSADGLRDFMLKIKEEKEESGDRQSNYLSTHPAPAERVEYLEDLIINNGYERYIYMGVKKHQEIKEKLRNLIK